MKAYVLHGIGDLRYEETAGPSCTEASVIVRVKAAGVCGSDLPRIYRDGAHRMPLIPGHEFSGIVAETGPGVPKDWKGQRVGVFPLLPCGKCPSCQKKEYELCRDYSYLGSRTDGGFAEYVRIPVWNLLRLPGQVTYEQAAMLEPMAVAVHAVRRGGCKKGGTAAVCGLGTIGLLVVMILKEMGCEKVYAAGNKEFRRRAAESFGVPAEMYCGCRTESLKEWILEKTRGEGVDVFFDCAGKGSVLSDGIESAAAGGRIVLVGNPSSHVELLKEVYWKILRRQLTLTGTWNSAFRHEGEDDWRTALRKLEEGRFNPERLITHRLEFCRLKEGLEMMREKTEEYGKVMAVLQ